MTCILNLQVYSKGLGDEMNKAKAPSKYDQALSSLPELLREPFKELFEDYKFWTAVRHGHPFVSAFVLADLVKVGWRRSSESLEDCTHEEKNDIVKRQAQSAFSP